MTAESTDETLRKILKRDRVVAVVGLSDKPHRASYQVAAYLQRHGYRIVPVNPSLAGRAVLGETAFSSLAEAKAALAAQGLAIGMVDVFRKSADVPAVATDAIAIGAHSLWLQLGIVHDEAVAGARAAGLDAVMDLCVKIEHRRLAE